MSKTLITALGLVVSLGVIALGVLLVAMPLYFQSTAVDTQTQTVAGANAVYQAEVDSLREQEGNLPAINASVEGLRAEIPAIAQLDDVFEVIAKAADSTGVSIQSVTAGEQVVFVARTGEVADAAAAPLAPESTEATEGADVAETTDAATGEAAAEPVTPVADGRQQVDFVIQIEAADMNQATAFLDALRAGPRLLTSIQSTASQPGGGVIGLQVSALTYLDSEG